MMDEGMVGESWVNYALVALLAAAVVILYYEVFVPVPTKPYTYIDNMLEACFTYGPESIQAGYGVPVVCVSCDALHKYGINGPEVHWLAIQNINKCEIYNQTEEKE